MIFVFGSNRAGIHGAGAALYAHKQLGAKWGIGEGLTGDCYALPTKGYNIENLTLEEIKNHVDEFIHTAKQHSQLKFKVTAVGTGLAIWNHENIAPLFEHAPDNCFFDTLWKPYLGETKSYWGTF